MSFGPKKTIGEQIAHMKSKGIQFTIMSEEKAAEYLENNNDYFKLRAYRKNYRKNGEGKYVCLEFAYLRDLAIIDMQTRYLLLKMCLDIEHAVRVFLIKTIVDIDGEDGYSVISDFRNINPDLYDTTIDHASKSPYCADLKNKYENNMPIWAFVEMLQFNGLCNLCMFIAKRTDNKSMLNDYYVMQEIRRLRNACAHSNCIINDLNPSANSACKPDSLMVKEISKIPEISKVTRQKKLQNDRIRQIVTLLYFFKRCVKSNDVQKYRSKEMRAVLVDRCKRHLEYYQNCDLVKSYFSFIEKLIDGWFPE